MSVDYVAKRYTTKVQCSHGTPGITLMLAATM
jgi:hypothetical protein